MTAATMLPQQLADERMKLVALPVSVDYVNVIDGNADM